MNYKTIVLWLLLPGCGSDSGARGAGGSLDSADSSLAQLGARIDSLDAHLRGGPRTADPATEQRALEQRWQQFETLLDSLAKIHGPSAGLEYRRGELFRVGTKMQVPSAFDSAEAHLRQALALAPDHQDARLSLAALFVNSGPRFAPAAESLFTTVLQSADSSKMAIARQGLMFAYYYQGRLPEAKEIARRILTESPQNPVAQMVLNATQAPR